MKLAGKVAIVTGASRGIGKAIAIELARAGAQVAVLARTVDEKQRKDHLPGTIYTTVEEIERLGGTAIPIRCDVSREKDVSEAVAQVNSKYGPVDILVNNAGVTTTQPFLELTLKHWDLLMAVNLRGMFLCTKTVLPQMVERRRGSIINMSSVLAKRVKRSIPYGTSKAAIERFTLGLAREMLKYNIAVNALCPDFTATEAVKAFMPNTDTSAWQSPEMWGKYAVLVAMQDVQSLTGRILDEATLRDIFGPVYP